MIDYMKLAQVAYREVTHEYRQHNCIGMAAAVLTALNLAGKDGAFPLTVRVHVTNPHFTRLIESAKSPATQQQMDRWGSQKGSFQYSIGFEGSKKREDDWPGHLVVIVPEAINGQTTMFDLTIMQADLPEQDIVLRPVAAGVKPGFLKGESPFGLKVNGSRLLYLAYPDDRSFEETVVWNAGDIHDSLALRILTGL